MTYAEFAQTNKITLTLGRRYDNPYTDFGPMAKHWNLTLQYNGRNATFVYSQGSGIKHDPTIPDLLSCLRMDASSYDMPFKTFCAEFGYKTDTTQQRLAAQKIWQGCRENNDRLYKLLGSEVFLELFEVEDEEYG